MKISFRRLAIAFSALGLALPAVCFAALSANLPVSGTVAANNSIAVTPNGTNNTSLDIIDGNTSGVNVASALETSNDENGYKIAVTSANNGELQLGSTDSTRETAYQISYDGGSYISPTTSSQTLKSVASLSGLSTHTSQILVTLTAYPTAAAGTYSDTLTFAIVAN